MDCLFTEEIGTWYVKQGHLPLIIEIVLSIHLFNSDPLMKDDTVFNTNI